MEIPKKISTATRTVVFDQILKDYGITELGDNVYQVQRDGTTHEGSFNHVVEIAKKDDLAGDGNPAASE